MAELFKQHDSLEGEIHSIVYRNESNAFTVARLRQPGRRKTVDTIIGPLAGVQPGENVKLTGQWIENKKYGKQFQVKSYVVETPRTETGLTKYLSSGILPGVGAKTAERIVASLGRDTLKVLDHEPERLESIAGLGRSRVNKIISGWKSHRHVHEVMVFLQSFEIGPAMAARIYRVYKDQAPRILKTNPYRLAWEVHGIGFKKADQIARSMGIAEDSLERCEAAAIYFLQKCSEKGHVCYPLDTMMSEVQQMIEVGEDAIASGIRAGVDNERLVIEEQSWDGQAADDEAGGQWRGFVIYLKKLYDAETGCAEELGRLFETALGQHSGKADRRLPCNEDDRIEAIKSFLCKRRGPKLGPEQMDALLKVLASPCLVVTGGPGTGKTTMIRAVVEFLEERKLLVMLAAPTGRAAKRLAEATGRTAKTIHRLLEYKPRERNFSFNSETPLPCDCLIVDETSMVDVQLMHQLLQAVANGTRLVFVGDIDQLPSVGSGNVLKDLIHSGVVSVARLTQIYRQSRASMIAVNAHRVNRGEFPELTPFEEHDRDVEEGGSDFLYLRAESPEQMVGQIVKLCRQALPHRFQVDHRDDIQVITPMHRGDVGSLNLNKVLQSSLNPNGAALNRGDALFRQDDRVMQVRNNYDKEVFNGDIGVVVSVDGEELELTVRFDSSRVIYTQSELDELELAYAVTVHKSQGSEYPVVVMPIATQHFIMLQRNLLYTAITRARMVVVLVGQTKALALALKNDRVAQRYSFLASRLRQGLGLA